MQMKFMQKTKEKNEREINEQNNKLLIDEELNDNLRKEGQRYYINWSHLYCEQLKSGRLSFKGMNHEIEKLMQENDSNEVSQDQSEKTCDVSDEEMTNRYSYLIDSNRKRTKHSQRNRTAKRFKRV